MNSVWFHRWITVMYVGKGDVREFWHFEYELTPLWFWE
jgi:hypothetical protein